MAPCDIDHMTAEIEAEGMCPEKVLLLSDIISLITLTVLAPAYHEVGPNHGLLAKKGQVVRP